MGSCLIKIVDTWCSLFAMTSSTSITLEAVGGVSKSGKNARCGVVTHTPTAHQAADVIRQNL